MEWTGEEALAAALHVIAAMMRNRRRANAAAGLIAALARRADPG